MKWITRLLSDFLLSRNLESNRLLSSRQPTESRYTRLACVTKADGSTDSEGIASSQNGILSW